MRADALEAVKAGIFGAILIGLSSLLSGIFTQLFFLDPIIYFTIMAGVLFPAMMVTAGILAWWASDSPFADPGLRPDGNDRIVLSLTSGMVTALAGSILWLFTLEVAFDNIFRVPAMTLASPEWCILIGLAVLLTAYTALSVIGGILYDIIVRREKPIR